MLEFIKNLFAPKTTPKPDMYYSELDFLMDHKPTVKGFEDSMVNHVVAANKIKDLNEKLTELKAAEQAYNSLKQFCYSKGPAAVDYMNKMWDKVDERSGMSWIQRVRDTKYKTQEQIKDHE